ncbi:hypothetical protein C5610_12620 [Idiomarina sp. OT37-5b]|uniref:hypothetical protein n=1 Tax=Idiomarina sp. OT37-5b TaxID=2100422 RepID=UPI000CF94840|nr:hypothetical protein [Idiomarina sp. OT37-5b]AVJ57052.1 hypothetical protein C5610_12620 [Idiomarina sp. OT37-5b]
MEETVEELIELWRSDPLKMKDLRVFVIEEKFIFRFVNRRFKKTHHINEFGYASINKLDRGKILSIFAKLEFLVNECINLFLHSVKPNLTGKVKYFKDNPKAENLVLTVSPIYQSELPSMIQDIPFKSRIEYIERLGIIDNDRKMAMLDLASTRNFLAHEWEEKLCEYKERMLKEKSVLNDFSIDIRSSFETLVNCYVELQGKVGYKELLASHNQKVIEQNQNQP